ncbi:MAG TPA: DUF134 domain-containing protein [Candidatus Aminicenantes bacterium]|nr:DUF134 domain-containing protein [Candidatus Aminicenantes bacterium]
MPRPCKCRRVGFVPDATLFKPAGIPARDLPEVALALDELEALRLADLEGLYHEQAAARMGVSRQTFGNVVAAARRKTADCLVNGKVLRIAGSAVQAGEGEFVCGSCRHRWRQDAGAPPPARCPACRRGTGRAGAGRRVHERSQSTQGETQ